MRLHGIWIAAFLLGCQSSGSGQGKVETAPTVASTGQPQGYPGGEVASTPPQPAGSPSPTPPASAPSYPPLAPLAPEKLQKAEPVLKTIAGVKDPDGRLRAAAQFLAELEEGRLPKQATDALSAAGAMTVDARYRAHLCYSAVAETPDLLAAWNHACDPGRFGDGGRVLANFTSKSISDREKSAAVYGLCRLARRGLVAKPENLTEAHEVLVLAHTLHAYLEQRGGLADVEQRALVVLAQAGTPFAKPITATDLPPAEEPPALTGPAAEALRKRVVEGLTLLEAGDVARFLRRLAHPKELAKLEAQGGIDEVAAKAAGSERLARLRSALQWARDHQAIDDGKGRARYLPPFSTAMDAVNELEFRKHEGVWYLDL